MNHPYQQRSSDVPMVMAWNFIVRMTMEMLLLSMLVQMGMGPTCH
jgi:hypothetical protein